MNGDVLARRQWISEFRPVGIVLHKIGRALTSRSGDPGGRPLCPHGSGRQCALWSSLRNRAVTRVEHVRRGAPEFRSQSIGGPPANLELAD